MAGQLKILTSVATTAEAEMVSALLLDAGIHVIAQRATGGPEQALSLGRDLWVSERDYDCARELLKSQENAVSDEELTRLSEQAGREADETNER
jgi:Putative prokaryotic signal transducing protein